MNNKTRMKPYNAFTEEDVCKLREDNFPRRNNKFSIFVSGPTISLHAPKEGYMVIPKEEFNAIVDWYIKFQNPPRNATE